MSWYYAENNERRGPVDDAAFQSLVAAGTITPQTLVWSEGMAEWTPHGTIASTVPLPAPTMPAGGASDAPAGAQSCRECGRLFPVDEMLSYEGRFVCVACKPLFFQKIREGAAVTGQLEYAGFWIRFVAKFVDGVLINVLGKLITLTAGAILPEQTGAIVAPLLGLILGAAYTIYFVGKYGATPGKLACKLQIVRADGMPMEYGPATGRYFAEFVSAFTLGIGYIMVAFDEEKRALHDRICNTRVVRKR